MPTDIFATSARSSIAPELEFRDDGSLKMESYKRTPVQGYATEVHGARQSDWAMGWMKSVVYKPGTGSRQQGQKAFPEVLPDLAVFDWMTSENCGCNNKHTGCDSCASGGVCYAESSEASSLATTGLKATVGTANQDPGPHDQDARPQHRLPWEPLPFVNPLEAELLESPFPPPQEPIQLPATPWPAVFPCDGKAHGRMRMTLTPPMEWTATDTAMGDKWTEDLDDVRELARLSARRLALLRGQQHLPLGPTGNCSNEGCKTKCERTQHYSYVINCKVTYSKCTEIVWPVKIKNTDWPGPKPKIGGIPLPALYWHWFCIATVKCTWKDYEVWTKCECPKGKKL